MISIYLLSSFVQEVVRRKEYFLSAPFHLVQQGVEGAPSPFSPCVVDGRRLTLDLEIKLIKSRDLVAR